MKLEIRKIVTVIDKILVEGGKDSKNGPCVKVASGAIIKNPMAGRFETDLSGFFDIGEQIGDLLTREAQTATGKVPFESFGKAAIVGVDGELEHIAAMLHTKMGLAMRRLVGGGKAMIPSTAKRAPAGTVIDIPLHYKDAATLLSHYDTIELAIPDGPRADEILVAVAYGTGTRPQPRIGGLSKEEVTTGDRYAFTGTMVFTSVDGSGTAGSSV